MDDDYCQYLYFHYYGTFEVPQLIYLIGKGDQAAYEELVSRNVKLVHLILRTYVKNPWDLEELTQDVFLNMWKYCSTYNPKKGNFSTWIGRIARNIAYKYVKLKESEKKQEEALQVELKFLNNCDFYNDDYYTSKKLGKEFTIKEQLAKSFKENLKDGNLTSDQYELLVLKYLYRLQDDEIAKTIKTKDVKTIRRQIIEAEDIIMISFNEYCDQLRNFGEKKTE